MRTCRHKEALVGYVGITRTDRNWWRTKVGRAFCQPDNLLFLDRLLDGTRGENWGRAVGGYMLDGCTTRGDIEVGGL
jgi:hypothetical protein